ncbi:hypothetical protein BTVI_149508 [Pitangus sulphuratus]|nr:hypothetical protein BTVI_149508 [Pitangus sulphuratus]
MEIGHRLISMVLEVFSNLRVSGILPPAMNLLEEEDPRSSYAPLRKAKFVESPRIPESELGSPTLSAAQKLDVDAFCPGDTEQELGPPPSVDEAANTLMTRLGFLLGEKVTEVQPGPQYSMEVQDENQSSAVTQRISPCSTLTSSTASPPASSPCSTLPPVSTSVTAKDCTYGAVTSPTSTLESRDSGIIGECPA